MKYREPQLLGRAKNPKTWLVPCTQQEAPRMDRSNPGSFRKSSSLGFSPPFLDVLLSCSCLAPGRVSRMRPLVQEPSPRVAPVPNIWGRLVSAPVAGLPAELTLNQVRHSPTTAHRKPRSVSIPTWTSPPAFHDPADTSPRSKGTPLKGNA